MAILHGNLSRQENVGLRVGLHSAVAVLVVKAFSIRVNPRKSVAKISTYFTESNSAFQ